MLGLLKLGKLPVPVPVLYQYPSLCLNVPNLNRFWKEYGNVRCNECNGTIAFIYCDVTRFIYCDVTRFVPKPNTAAKLGSSFKVFQPMSNEFLLPVPGLSCEFVLSDANLCTCLNTFRLPVIHACSIESVFYACKCKFTMYFIQLLLRFNLKWSFCCTRPVQRNLSEVISVPL